MANKKMKSKVKSKVKSKAKAKAKAKVTAKKSPIKKSAKKNVKKVVAKKPVKKTVKKALTKTPAKKSVAPKKATSVAKPTKLQTKASVDYSQAITPLGDRLVVRVESLERVTAGGLIIPSSVSQATGFLKATVLAVGSGATNKKGMLRPLDVKKGDTVLFADHSGTKVEFNREELQIIHESDVMGIVQ